MIITVALNPAVDQTVEVEQFQQADTNRVLAIRWDIGGKGIFSGGLLANGPHLPEAGQL